MKNMDTAFTAALLTQLSQGEALTGIPEVRLRQQAEKDGGVKAVQMMIARRQETRQFQKLKEMKRLELSVEALVIQGKYAALFTDEEVNECLGILLEGGMF